MNLTMITIAIVPETPGSPTTRYRAVAGQRYSVGQTAGQALDALTSQMGDADAGTIIVVQRARPDALFDATQQQRLEDLMARWRAARDAGTSLPPAEQAELERL